MGSACHVTQKSSVLSCSIVLSGQWPCPDSDLRPVGIPRGKSSRMALMLTTRSLGLSACLLSAVLQTPKSGDVSRRINKEVLTHVWFHRVACSVKLEWE